MAKKAKAPVAVAGVSTETLKAALEMKAKGLITDEQFAALTGASAPVTAPAPVPEAPKAVVSGSGSAGAVPALEKAGAKVSAAVAAGKAKLMGLGSAKPAGKSKTAEVTIPEVMEAIDEFIKQLAAKKAAEARLGELGEDIAGKAEPQRVEVSRRMGELQASLYVNKRVTYIQPHGYKTVDPDKEAMLQAIFGAEYDQFFQPRLEVKVVNTDALAAVYEALEAICAENGMDASKIFSSKPTIAPTDALTSARVMRPEVAEKFAKAVEAGLIEPKKYTLKEK